MLRFKSLGSGSAGNGTVVEAQRGPHTTRLLVDCGFGQKQLEQRLAQAGLQPAQIDAIFITHEHGDHVGCAPQWALKHRIPVWMSHGTHAAIGLPDFDGLLHIARDTVAIDLGGLELTPFTVPHDAREPLQLRCRNGDTQLGILTDLGHATPHVLEHLMGCQALLLECNHDVDLLAASRYPPFLKQRVGGMYGHLANHAAAEIAQALALGGLRRIMAAHLSEQNNRPELALAALAEASACADITLGVASAAHGTEWLAV
ncbi:MBL fold metallo-hydrolase [Rhodoferax sp.]|uniref:MBL fold metallo-hydrolase n=1 Tax=Rhodoferax sp. TaxID=50421 RepID=UPI00374DA5FE